MLALSLELLLATLKMDAVGYSEMLRPIYRTAWYHIPESNVLIFITIGISNLGYLDQLP
jgi:hypothetical protein